jgi:16S rRNA (cytosine967-C5)-methyltransferase
LKLHKNLCEAIVNGLDQVFIQDSHAGQVVEQLLLSNKKWGARDRNFIAEHLYTVIRYYRLYCHAAGLSAMNIPESDAWKVLGAYFIDKEAELSQWEEWSDLNINDVKERLIEGRNIRQIRESIPDWLDERALAELGDRWEAELHALNQPAPLCIRINTLKASRDSVIEFLRSEEIEFKTSDIAPDAIIIQSKKNLRSSYAYKSGWFEIQDLSSQLVAKALSPSSGMVVIDACAGAGGKTMHIAALIKGRGDIIAIDVYQDKLKELELRARRNGADNINTSVYTQGLEKRYEAQADCLLLDVPCSATGVIRRNPDTKWKLKEEELERLIALQQDLLHRYSIMLKPSGIMVYATCSILPSENEKQIAAFLSDHPGYSIVEEQKISAAGDGDGFYICKMTKEK